MEAKHAVSYMTCTQNANPEMFRNIPQEANIPIPVKSDMLKVTHGHHEGEKNLWSILFKSFMFTDVFVHIALIG